MYQKLQKSGGKWGAVSFFPVVGNVCLMAFYTVVAGWMIHYFFRFLTGRYDDISFASMIASPGINVTFLAVTVVLVFAVLSFGWGWDHFVQEANTGSGWKIRSWMRPVFQYALPVIIAFVYVYGLATFKGR